MSKHLTGFLGFVLVSSSFTYPAVAAPQAPPSTDENTAFCREFIQAFPTVTLGRCLSYVQTQELGAAGFIARQCSAFESSDPEDFYLIYDSVADCISSAPRH